MPTIRELNAGPPRRLIVRIAAGIGFVLAVYLYVSHVEANDRQRLESANHVLATINAGKPAAALSEAVEAHQSLGGSSELSRATWAALMAGGGRHGSKALLRRTLPYELVGPELTSQLSFSSDGRFLAAIDGTTITVWNAQDGSQVVTTSAGDRFVGFFRVGSRYFGLLASHQYYDLISDVISLPETYRYAQPSKDALTSVVPGGDWAYRLPMLELGRTEYPIKLINLHTGEKREVDVNYPGLGAVAVNPTATRIAVWPPDDVDGSHVDLWDARSRSHIGRRQTEGDAIAQLYFSSAMKALVAVSEPATPLPPGSFDPRPHVKYALRVVNADDGVDGFNIRMLSETPLAVADDPHGLWFAIRTPAGIELYRGVNSPLLNTIAEREISRAPATSR